MHCWVGCLVSNCCVNEICEARHLWLSHLVLKRLSQMSRWQYCQEGSCSIGNARYVHAELTALTFSLTVRLHTRAVGAAA